jgi:WD40 repeat protein
LLGLLVWLGLAPLGRAQKPPRLLPVPKPVPLWKDLKATEIDLMAMSSDGRLVAIVHRYSGSKPLALYDRVTGKKIRHFDNRYLIGSTYALHFTPDGKHVVLGCGREANPRIDEARVYEVSTGHLLRIIAFRQGQLAWQGRMAVSNKLVMVAGENELGGGYELTTGKELKGFTGQERAQCLSLSADGAWLLVGGKTDPLLLWDVGKRQFVNPLLGKGEQIAAVAFSGDGIWCASLSRRGRLCVFDRKTRKELANTDGFMSAGATAKLMFTADGQTVVATGYCYPDGVRFWDWKSGGGVRGGDPKKKVPGGVRLQAKVIDEASLASDGTLLTRGSGGVLMWKVESAKSAAQQPRK